MITRNPAQSARCWPYANLLLPKPPDGTISSSMGSTVAIIPSSITLLASHSNNSAESYSGSLLPSAAPVARPSPLPRRRFAGRPRAPAMSAAFKAFLNSPVGPKTTHFWGPVSNWGIILAVRITIITAPPPRAVPFA